MNLDFSLLIFQHLTFVSGVISASSLVLIGMGQGITPGLMNSFTLAGAAGIAILLCINFTFGMCLSSFNVKWLLCDVE